MSASVNLYCEDGVKLAIDERELSRVFDLVLAEEGVDRECCVSVSVLGERSMQELNAQWRGVESPTDVISLECERPDDPELAPGEPCELGDIAMAPEVLAAQSTRFGTTPADETRLMAIRLAAPPARLRPHRRGRRPRHGGPRGRASRACVRS